MTTFKEICEKTIQEKLQSALSLQQKLRRVLLSSNVKPIEDFISTRNDSESLFEAVELLLRKRETEVNEASMKL